MAKEIDRDPESPAQVRSVWPPPSGITVLPEIKPSPESVKKYTAILLNNLPPADRKILEEILKHPNRIVGH